MNPIKLLGLFLHTLIWILTLYSLRGLQWSHCLGFHSVSYETHDTELCMTGCPSSGRVWITWVGPPITAHELLHAFLQFLLAPPLHHHLWVGDCPREAGLRHVLVDLCCQTTVFPKPQNEEDDWRVRIHNTWKKKRRQMEEQRGQSLNHYSFLSSGAFFAFLGIKKKTRSSPRTERM